jgi:hypothetical protein
LEGRREDHHGHSSKTSDTQDLGEEDDGDQDLAGGGPEVVEEGNDLERVREEGGERKKEGGGASRRPSRPLLPNKRHPGFGRGG